MHVERRTGHVFFSICIPQYNRTSFLLKTLESIQEQTSRDFEICISDDGSTDRREEEILNFLATSNMGYVYKKREKNGRYDVNLRDSIGLARGKYCFLLGNDDALAVPETLELLAKDINNFHKPDVVLTNYADFTTFQISKRVRSTGVKGRGAGTAIRYFRDFSFVSGIVLKREPAQAEATDHIDGTEMYQLYLACRLLAMGGTLLGISQPVIRKDIQVRGDAVDSYAHRYNSGVLVERRLPLSRLAGVAVSAVKPYVRSRYMDVAIFKVVRQIYLYPYFYWLFEYRRVQSWRYAAGIALGMRPRHVLDGLALSWIGKCLVCGLFSVVTLIGLLVPVRLFRALQKPLYWIAKNVR